jgi:DNA invertase Pin-like site-specific DNA recombinase
MSTFDTPCKATASQRARLACIYIRQSSFSQVAHHGESTEMQYRLMERALALGWPRDRIRILDEDLGKSATSAQDRPGFQQLIAEIGLGRVGLVLSLDASRLARNCSDWHRLIELCALFGALIADGERLYDPRQYHDWLVLGLSGMMSEAELHQLKIRLHAGEQQKAERGELRVGLPVGLERQRDGSVTLNPDDEIQARLRLVFAKFDELGTAHAVVRYLCRHNLPLPTRPHCGPEPYEIVWQKANARRILAILHNPAYAGAYVYGRSTVDPAKRRAGHPGSGLIHRPLGQWPICLQGIYPAYISWEHYLANQERLQNNRNRYEQSRHGAPRQGQALLQGIVLCGRCGSRMCLRYYGPQGQYPAYRCARAHDESDAPRCQEARALALDAAVERQLLEALAPDRLAVALSAMEQMEQEGAALRHQWQLRLERARYEAERARRQFNAVEPENRLVARNLERQWEDQLRTVEELAQAYQRWTQQHGGTSTEADRAAIVALGEDLPRVWNAPTTTAGDRKRLLRLVIASVVVDARRQRGRLWYRINWQTGATTEQWLTRRVHSYGEYPLREELQERMRALHVQGKMDKEIAAELNAGGMLTARGQRCSSKQVWVLRQQWQIPTVKENSKNRHPASWPDGTYSIEGAAGRIGVTIGTIYKWVHTGRIQGRQRKVGMPWKLLLNEGAIIALKECVQRGQRTKRSKKEAS